MKSFTAAAALAFVSGAAARTFTVYNNCPYTIWYVVYVVQYLTHSLISHLNNVGLPCVCQP